MDIAQEMLTKFNDSTNHYIETKAQSSQWKRPERPRPKEAHQVRSNVKVLHTVFFDCNGVVHHEFLPQGRTVNKEYYLEVTSRLCEAILQKCMELWILHHDNAPAYTSMFVGEFLADSDQKRTKLCKNQSWILQHVNAPVHI